MNVDEAVELDDDDASETYVVDAADRPEIARFHGHSCRVFVPRAACVAASCGRRRLLGPPSRERACLRCDLRRSS